MVYSILDKMRLIEEINKEHTELICKSLTKMQNFLVDNGIAPSRKEVKSFPRIEIKGVHKNGKERLIREEIEQSYDIDLLEESKGFNTYYPPIETGVIKSSTEYYGTYYTMFNVTSETEEVFNIDILEFRYFNNVFYLNYIISLESVQKHTPLSPVRNSYATIEEFFVKQFSEKQRSEFTDDEMSAIRDATPAVDEIEVDAICTTTLSIFRVVNFILERNQTDGKIPNEYFYDNEYFSIKHWDSESLKETHVQQSNLDKEYIEGILKIDNGFQILKTHSIAYVINEIVKETNISTFYAAVGFVFQSGLQMLSSVFDQLLQVGGECELIVGTLQNFDCEMENNRINRNTVQGLNVLLSKKQIRLFTYRPAFYHGKFYYMCNGDKAFIIVGSSNISQQAFQNNFELDVVYVMDKNSYQSKLFIEWYSKLKKECEEIDCLDEQHFEEFNWNSELDIYHTLKNNIISNNEIWNRINQLDDEETRYRLEMWMSKNPTNVYEDVGIEALNNYIVFVYLQEKLAVFESFTPSNAYYVFRIGEDLMNLLNDISKMTKSQMSLSKHYIKKGYHTLSKESLERRINSYFEFKTGS